MHSVNKEMATSSEAAVGWDELKAGIAKAFESDRVDVDEVRQLMSSYVSCRSDWERYEVFDKHKYVCGHCKLSVRLADLLLEGLLAS